MHLARTQFTTRYDQTVGAYGLNTTRNTKRPPPSANTAKDPLRHNALCRGMNDPHGAALLVLGKSGIRVELFSFEEIRQRATRKEYYVIRHTKDTRESPRETRRQNVCSTFLRVDFAFQLRFGYLIGQR